MKNIFSRTVQATIISPPNENSTKVTIILSLPEI